MVMGSAAVAVSCAESVTLMVRTYLPVTGEGHVKVVVRRWI